MSLRFARKTAAFSLPEVLVAVAIFAIATIGLAAAYVDVLNSLERVKTDQQLEQDLAFVRARVLLEPELPEVERGGEVPTANHGTARWSATVTPSERVADLFRVALEIQFEGTDDRAGPRLVRQRLHLLRPDWSEPTARDDVRSRRRQEIDDGKSRRPL